jgi:hypothetical protein
MRRAAPHPARAAAQQTFLEDVEHRACAGSRRRERVLEDDLHLAAGSPQRVSLQLEQVAAVQQGLALDLGLPAQQLHDGLAGGGLAAARLAHQRQRLAGTNAEGHAAHGVEVPCRALQQTLAEGKRTRRSRTSSTGAAAGSPWGAATVAAAVAVITGAAATAPGT